MFSPLMLRWGLHLYSTIDLMKQKYFKQEIWVLLPIILIAAIPSSHVFQWDSTMKQPDIDDSEHWCWWVLVIFPIIRHIFSTKQIYLPGEFKLVHIRSLRIQENFEAKRWKVLLKRLFRSFQFEISGSTFKCIHSCLSGVPILEEGTAEYVFNKSLYPSLSVPFPMEPTYHFWLYITISFMHNFRYSTFFSSLPLLGWRSVACSN